MQKFIGVKMIEATPMTAEEASVVLDKPLYTDNAEEDANGDHPGYLVGYGDGYHSWSPKAQFEKAYFPLAAEDGSRISPEDVEAFLGDITYTKVGERSLSVTATMRTGFEAHEFSSCVDPANFDEKIGVEAAVPRLKGAVWLGLGFVLRWAKYGLSELDAPEELAAPEVTNHDD